MIDYFSGSAGKSFDVGYLISKYREYGLNEKIEDIDFSVDEWYKNKYEINNFKPFNDDTEVLIKMTEEEYVRHLIDKRKKETEE